MSLRYLTIKEAINGLSFEEFKTLVEESLDGFSLEKQRDIKNAVYNKYQENKVTRKESKQQIFIEKVIKLIGENPYNYSINIRRRDISIRMDGGSKPDHYPFHWHEKLLLIITEDDCQIVNVPKCMCRDPILCGGCRHGTLLATQKNGNLTIECSIPYSVFKEYIQKIMKIVDPVIKNFDDFF